MTSEGGPHREGLLGEFLDQVKDMATEDDAPEEPDFEPDSRPAPESGRPIGGGARPPSHHDSEQRLPPPVSGSID